MEPLETIDERLNQLKHYISYMIHCKINNCYGGNKHTCTFDQWLYSKHIDELMLPDAMVIPMITDEYGKYWEQPDNRNIYIDEQFALMTKVDFDKLKNYSHSIPTGVYDGKMWKLKSRKDDASDLNYYWHLAWYSPSENPKNCMINIRLIKILPERNYRYENDAKRTLTILTD